MRYGNSINLAEIAYGISTPMDALDGIIQVIRPGVVAASVHFGSQNPSIVIMKESSEDGDWAVASNNEIDTGNDEITGIRVYQNYMVVSSSSANMVGVFIIENDLSLTEVYSLGVSDFPEGSSNIGRNIEFSDKTLIVSYLYKGYGVCDAFLFNSGYSSVVRQQTLLKSFGGETESAVGDNYGESLCIYDNILFVGASGINLGRGKVYSYVRSSASSEWIPSEIIESPNRKQGENFGKSICTSEDYLFISAVGLSILRDAVEYVGYGGVYVFKYDGISWSYFNLVQSSQPVSIDNVRFGENIDAVGDRLIVSRQNGDAIEVFDKNRGWGYSYSLSEVVNSGIGQSLSVSDDILLATDTSNNIYLYALQQRSSVLSQSLPISQLVSKCSLYLERSISGETQSYWEILNNDRIVIDAANIIGDKDGNLMLSRNSQSTGAGLVSTDINGCVLRYPIRKPVPGRIYLAFRCISGGGNIDLLIDGDIIRENIIQTPEMSGSFEWSYIEVVIPDSESKNIELNIKGADVFVDKIIIDNIFTEYFFKGPAYTNSPYCTIYVSLHSGEFYPVDRLSFDAVKDSLYQVTRKGWYNFMINSESIPSANGILRVCVAGSSPSHYISWISETFSQSSDSVFTSDVIY